MSCISVIIPIYNVEKYLSKCVDSVINQSFKDIEIILVDDGSTDNSGSICDCYAEKDKRIKVIHKKNGGLSEARNYGLNQATSEYVLFLDSDDYWVEDCLINIVNSIEEEYKVDVMFLSSIKYFENRDKLDNKFEVLERDKIKGKSQEEVLKYLASSQKFPVSACTKLIRRSLIVNNKLYFQKGLLSEDIDWSTKLLCCATKFDVCQSDFYVYRKQRKGSITSEVSLKNIQDMIYIIKKWQDKCNNNEINKKISSSLLALYAYEYSILIGHLFSISREERKIVYEDVKSLKDILKYSQSSKTKLVRLIVDIFGLNISAYILNKYIVYSVK